MRVTPETLRAAAQTPEYLAKQAIHGLLTEAAYEIERLCACLKRANDQAEHFEREWYLRGEELQELQNKGQHMHEDRSELPVDDDPLKGTKCDCGAPAVLMVQGERDVFHSVSDSGVPLYTTEPVGEPTYYCVDHVPPRYMW